MSDAYVTSQRAFGAGSAHRRSAAAALALATLACVALPAAARADWALVDANMQVTHAPPASTLQAGDRLSVRAVGTWDSANGHLVRYPADRASRQHFHVTRLRAHEDPAVTMVRMEARKSTAPYTRVELTAFAPLRRPVAVRWHEGEADPVPAGCASDTFAAAAGWLGVFSGQRDPLEIPKLLAPQCLS